MSGTADKIEGEYDKAAGKVKEETGEALDDKELENKGKAQQVEGHVNKAKGEVKDALD